MQLYNISKVIERNRIITSIEIQKAFDKVQHVFMIKVLGTFGINGACLKIIKAIYNKLMTNVIVIGDKQRLFLLKSRTRQGCCTSQGPLEEETDRMSIYIKRGVIRLAYTIRSMESNSGYLIWERLRISVHKAACLQQFQSGAKSLEDVCILILVVVRVRGKSEEVCSNIGEESPQEQDI